VVGDGVAEFSVVVPGVGESAAGPPALPGLGVGVQGAADEQAVFGDGVDAEQVAVGESAAGFAGFGGVVVAGGDDQVAGAGRGTRRAERAADSERDLEIGQ